MIESFRVSKLWGYRDYAFNAQDDLNILTGSNGTGKTTLLKLMWYMISGHIRQALTEIVFSEAEIITKTGSVKLIKRPAQTGDTDPLSKNQLHANTLVADIFIKSFDELTVFPNRPVPIEGLSYSLNEEGPSQKFASLFFPTFRRIEGGFSIDEGNESIRIIEGFRDFSLRMTHQQHRLLAFADYEDVKKIINQISSDIRVKLLPYEQEFTLFLSDFSNRQTNGKTIESTELKTRVIDLEKRREAINRPLVILSKKIDHFFLDKSVGITDDLVLGTNKKVVKIEHLSAGEKNILSFMVYAMSIPGGVMFIDEPELTLHYDWQRELLPALKEIAPNTQFFVATHSPAIRTNFPDKKIWLNEQIEEEALV